MSDIAQTPSRAVILAVRFFTAVAVLAVGVGIAAYLISTRAKPGKVPHENLGEIVEIFAAERGKHLVVVEASGQVLPAQQIALIPEVAGRIVWLSESLIPGGRLARDERVARIDARDYSLAMQQQYAQLDRAQTELELERSRKQIAEREWQLMGGGKPADALALRDPQLRTAEASLKAARSSLDRARLSVDRTTVRVPFNAMVHSKHIDLGQLVGPQTALATLVGTDAFWVQVAVPLDRLAWLRVPGVEGAAEGASAVITQRLGERTIRRNGTVIRLLPDLDPVGRMARLLIEIPDPLGLKDSAGDSEATALSELPLLIGSYVSVEIEGRELDEVFEIPREAVRRGDKLYVMADDSTLDIRDVQIVWRRQDSVLVREGLRTGDRVILSPVSAPVQGMKLRQAGADSDAADDTLAAPGDSPTAPADDTPADDTPADDTSVDDAPADDTPADDTSVDSQGAPSDGAGEPVKSARPVITPSR